MVEVWVAIITTAGLVLGAWINQSRQGKRLSDGLDRIRTDTSGVRMQVENDHSTNLRDDLDKLTSAVTTLTREVRMLRVDQVAEDANLWTALRRLAKGE